jgi:hypothetical protein
LNERTDGYIKLFNENLLPKELVSWKNFEFISIFIADFCWVFWKPEVYNYPYKVTKANENIPHIL